MTPIDFTKMQGAGNDFVVIEDCDEQLQLSAQQLQFLADRRCGIGSDGILLLRKDADFAYRMVFFNPDGGRAEMCANGARCIARFAVERGLAPESHTFLTDAGVLSANVEGERVQLIMPLPSSVQLHHTLSYDDRSPVPVHLANTGVPHAVYFVADVSAVDLADIGPAIRYHQDFSPTGTNANVAAAADGELRIRTWERGVEAETLACGTGVTAAAWLARELGLVHFPLRVHTQGGDVITIAEDHGQVIHTGPAEIAFRGQISL
ncbi:MAG TPA: diaminopimelate epimerase [Lentisphaeria bacterium]|nr:diaminopimelate epimerase [Lentisphaeria bacterium]